MYIRFFLIKKVLRITNSPLVRHLSYAKIVPIYIYISSSCLHSVDHHHHTFFLSGRFFFSWCHTQTHTHTSNEIGNNVSIHLFPHIEGNIIDVDIPHFWCMFSHFSFDAFFFIVEMCTNGSGNEFPYRNISFMIIIIMVIHTNMYHTTHHTYTRTWTISILSDTHIRFPLTSHSNEDEHKKEIHRTKWKFFFFSQFEKKMNRKNISSLNNKESRDALTWVLYIIWCWKGRNEECLCAAWSEKKRTATSNQMTMGKIFDDQHIHTWHTAHR